jgi:hypothetical protein
MQEVLEKQLVQIPVKEHLFSESVHHSGLTEYGISWQELNAGKVSIPAEGARFDIYFKGTLAGPKINGTIEGVDFLYVRADGRLMLNLQATITTDDGVKIALSEDGIMFPPSDETGIAELKLNFNFLANGSKYAWLNQCHVWGIGTVNTRTGEICVDAYSA